MLKPNTEIGKLIYKYRISRNLSQKEFADQLDVTLAAISNWERGQSKPSLVLCEKLARLMELSLDEFLVLSPTDKKMLYPLYSVIKESTFTLEVISSESVGQTYKLKMALSGLNLSEFLIKKTIKMHLENTPNKIIPIVEFQKTSHRLNHDLFIISIELDELNENEVLVIDFNNKEIRFELNVQLLNMIAYPPIQNGTVSENRLTIYKSKTFEHYLKFLIKNNNYNMILNHILFLAKNDN